MQKGVNLPVSGQRVFVGLSGGVDSSVSAALLAEAGAEVVGVFIQGWYPPGLPCTWAEERRDAMRLAARLSIPFATLDAAAEYKAGVIDYLLAEYKAGRTPNPDIQCNREVKFGVFDRYARSRGAAFIATGHYARLKDGALLRGADSAKDQSYFLWAVPRDVFSRTLFPIGGMKKDAVRALARRLTLPAAEKPDSQGICFLGAVSVEDFLRQEFGTEPGALVDASGRRVGTHDGVHLHTIGERIRVDAPGGAPWYVVGKDIAAHALIVSPARARAAETEFPLSSLNWLVESPPEGPVTAQFRYHGPELPGRFDAARGAFIADAPPEETLAPGQSLVLYRGDACLGGGIIG